MNWTKQFPEWLQRIIVVVAFLGGAWYLIGGLVTWVFQFSA